MEGYEKPPYLQFSFDAAVDKTSYMELFN